jgi:hypothetical protein
MIYALQFGESRDFGREAVAAIADFRHPLGYRTTTRPSRFLGNIHQLDLMKVHLILERWAAQYGPVYVFRMGSKHVLALSDPKWCDQVLRAAGNLLPSFSRCSRIFRCPLGLSQQGEDGLLLSPVGGRRSN